MSEKTRIVVAEDEGIIREALCLLVNSYDGMEIVGEASNGEQALELAASLIPDIILMDLKMPVLDGVETTRVIKSSLPGIKIIALTAVTDGKKVTESLSAGVDGFVIKKGSGGELKTAINSVLGGRRYICPEAAIIIADSYLAERNRNTSPFANLSNVESTILNLICEGLRATEIATRLGISKKTVEKYRDSLRFKAGVSTAAELAAAYIKFRNENTII
jgi:DNA-binding NarL/FixJ family response regulator